jgi:pimeloyl-ACP methyl ester carboxylesterase
VSIVQQPLTSLEDDVTATKRILDRQDGAVILVGHSYGGAIITEAGNDPRVTALVYVAAPAPDAGEVIGGLLQKTPAASTGIAPSKDGFLFLDPAVYAADCHVPFLSQPRALAKVIEEAARNTSLSRSLAGGKFE